MRAFVLSTGDELVRGRTADRNAGTLARTLTELGYVVAGMAVVGDDEDDLVRVVLDAASRADVVVMSGGLGPTPDDCTRGAAARAAGVSLVRVPELVAALERRYERAGRRLHPSNLLQAEIPEGAESIPNSVGTAPGFALDVGDARLFALPGPPHELARMIEDELVPRLMIRRGERDHVVRTRTLQTFGLPEALVGERLAEWMARGRRVAVGTSAKLGTIRISLTASGALAEVEELLDEAEGAVQSALGRAVFGRGEQTLAEVVVGTLAERGETVSTAESCTGGLVASLLTSVPGSSAVFPGGAVTYAPAEKTRALGVSRELLREHTPVSEAVAVDMARGARARFGTDYAVSVTGVAGPGADSDGNPEGLVFVALAHANGVEVRRRQVPGARRFIRTLAAKSALDLLRRRLITLD